MAEVQQKQYRNMFLEAGFSQEQIKAKIDSAVKTFFYGSEEERIYHEAEDETGYLVDTGNNDARTEGMSYGMMMCVQLDMKKEFDRIWKWAKKFMYMEDGENEGYFAWSCKLDGTKNAYGPAPDGEEFFAMALFFASHRWGNGEGIFNYEKEARAILHAAVHKGSGGRAGKPMWNNENHLILFVPGSPFSDPSYHLPHFYDLFALWADEEDREFFRIAAEESRKYLAISCHPKTGMNPEYAHFDGSPVLGEFWGWEHNHFFSDAYRTAANIGLDKVWANRDYGQYKAPANLIRFLRTPLEAARCVFDVDGTSLDKTVLHPVGLLAATAQGTLAIEKDSADYELALDWVRWFFNTPLRTGERRYYDNCLYLFALLALSGNYRIY